MSTHPDHVASPATDVAEHSRTALLKRVISIVAALLLASCGTPPIPAPSTEATSGSGSEGEAGLRCAAIEFTVSYPAGWYVHPADDSLGLGPCELFARDVFETEPETDWGWVGAQIVFRTGVGCRGSFERVVAEDELMIDGYPAYRQTLEPGEGAPTYRAYEYVIDLSSGQPCETSPWFYARTESDDPGSFEQNAATLDWMISSLDLHFDD